MILGLSGGVGSGKSLITQYLSESCGALILQTDKIAREISETNGPALDKIHMLFEGCDVFTPEGLMDRPKVAELIFADKDKKKALEDILHPAADEEISRRIAESKAQNPQRLIVIESAIFFESGCESYCDRVWAICADRKVRISRLMESRGYSCDRCESIMAGQMDDDTLARLSDEVIDNSGDFEKTKAQIDKALKTMRG